MPTAKEQAIQEINEHFDRFTEMLEEILAMLKRPQQYDYDRIILEVEDFLKEIG